MPTGDLRNSRARLKALLRSVQYPHALAASAESASVTDLLRVLHFALLDYSRAVAAFVQQSGYDLYGKTDARFVDCAFRLLRDAFKYFPSLTTAQFLSEHHWQRKLDVVSDVLELVVAKHSESARRARQQHAVWTEPKAPSDAPVRVDSHVLPVASSVAAASHAKTVLQLLHSSRHVHAPGGRSAAGPGDASGSDEPQRQRLVSAQQQQHRRSNGSSSSSARPEAWSTGPSDRRQETEDSVKTPHGRQVRLRVSLARPSTKSLTRGQWLDQQQRVSFAPASGSLCHRDRALDDVADGDAWRREADNEETRSSGSSASDRPTGPPRAPAADLAETLAALSTQIASLSSAFLTTIASVESRLSRLETQVHALSTRNDSSSSDLKDALCDASAATASTHRQSALLRSRADDADQEIVSERREWAARSSSSSSSHTESEAAKQLRRELAACAWPPAPAALTPI